MGLMGSRYMVDSYFHVHEVTAGYPGTGMPPRNTQMAHRDNLSSDTTVQHELACCLELRKRWIVGED